MKTTLIRDDALQGAPELLGPAGLELAAQLAEQAGGSVSSVRPEQALYSPGRSLIMNYRVTLSSSERNGGEEIVAAVVDRDGLPEGAQVRELAGDAVALWRFPHDPVLSSLERALDEEVLLSLLHELEVFPREVNVTPIVYRPTHRAVVRMDLRDDKLLFDCANGRLQIRKGASEIYLKIVPPEHAEEIGLVHDALRPHMRVPACYGGWADSGMLALEGLPGLTLRDFIRLGDGSPPSAERLLELLDTIGSVVSTEDRARSMRRRVRSHARLLRTILPDQEERIRRLSDELRQLPSERPAVIHGDFYDSQVLVDDGGAVAGLLDLDGVGCGNPADDAATMLGRIWTSGHTSSRGSDRFLSYAGELLDGFSRRFDRRDLCLRVAAIVFGRCTGPFRVQDDEWRAAALERLDLTERCLEHARRGELPF